MYFILTLKYKNPSHKLVKFLHINVYIERNVYLIINRNHTNEYKLCMLN